MILLSSEQRFELGRQAQLVIAARKRAKDAARLQDRIWQQYCRPEASDTVPSMSVSDAVDAMYAAQADYRKARERFFWARITLAIGRAGTAQVRKRLAQKLAAVDEADSRVTNARALAPLWHEERSKYLAAFQDMVRYKQELTSIANSGLRRDIPTHLRIAVHRRDG
jgi:hypothetical protein